MINDQEIYRVGHFLGMTEYEVHIGNSLTSHQSKSFYVTGSGSIIPSFLIRHVTYALLLGSMIVSSAWVFFSGIDPNHFGASDLIARMIPLILILGVHAIILMTINTWLFNRTGYQLVSSGMDNTVETPKAIDVTGITIQTKLLSERDDIRRLNGRRMR